MSRKARKHPAFMAEALSLAQQAFDQGEVPVGAIVVSEGRVVGRGFNTRERDSDPLGHAEILALRQASEALGSWRLPRSTLYVTLEPCVMCAGALLQARVDRVVFGCRDPKAGAVRSLYTLLEDPRQTHRAQIIEGIEAEACQELLVRFFKELRQGTKA